MIPERASKSASEQNDRCLPELNQEDSFLSRRGAHRRCLPSECQERYDETLARAALYMAATWNSWNRGNLEQLDQLVRLEQLEHMECGTVGSGCSIGTIGTESKVEQ